MGIFAFIASMFFAGFIGTVIYADNIKNKCNQIKIIEINDVKYKCEVLPDQKLNWTPSKAK